MVASTMLEVDPYRLKFGNSAFLYLSVDLSMRSAFSLQLLLRLLLPAQTYPTAW